MKDALIVSLLSLLPRNRGARGMQGRETAPHGLVEAAGTGLLFDPFEDDPR